MQTLNQLAPHSARRQGYIESLESIKLMLKATVPNAMENFYMLRDSDTNYDDPRTDFFLGKFDAITEVINNIEAMIEAGK